MCLVGFMYGLRPEDYCTNCEGGGMGRDRMAIMMISQSDKTKNSALNLFILKEKEFLWV